ncbi:hypothetical protein ACWZJV_26790 [Nocardioides sp. WG-D5]
MDSRAEARQNTAERGAGTGKRWRLAVASSVGAAMSVGLALLPTGGGAAAASEACAPKAAGQPMWVTADCVDPTYGKPVIDSQRDVAGDTPHHQVTGHFAGTSSRFNIYLPPVGQWEGRFYQIVYPLQSENASPRDIALAFDSGAYRVQTNGTSGYRVDAAAAKFAKTVAADYYGTSRQIHGYIYGGSGGSFQTIGAIENTTGVWDGAVPWIPAAPTSIPNNFFVRAFARIVLEDKAPQIGDAVQVGGSGDPYVGLTSPQKAILDEVTRMGVPLRAWKNYRYLLGLDDAQGLLAFAGAVRNLDPTYADDFWGERGYLGTEQSPLGDIFRASLVDRMPAVTTVNRNSQGQPTSLVLENAPSNPHITPFDFTAYGPDGTTKIGAVTGSLDAETKTLAIGSGTSSAVLDALTEGSKIRVDNRWTLALTAYHRYQVPKRSGLYAWDQFRDASGQPIYPQRSVEVGPTISKGAAGGGTFTGEINGKVIAVSNLLDVDAFPWHADFYASQVKAALGSSADENFRVYYNDNADHIGAHAPGLFDYEGTVEQALRDVSAWAERDVAPPASTRYTVSDSQIHVPATAVRRRGIQPTIDLTVNGHRRIEIEAGQDVTLSADIQVPPGAGQVISTEWDPNGSGTFTAAPFGPVRGRVKVRNTFSYDEPGVYIASLRVTASREGDPSAQFARVQNLGAVRIVVR